MQPEESISQVLSSVGSRALWDAAERANDRRGAHNLSIDGPYQAHFHTQSVTLCFPTTGGQGRADSLREWCEQVLQEKEREQDAQFFYFTSLPAHPDRLDLDLSPLSFFLRPVWAVPFQANQRIVLSP